MLYANLMTLPGEPKKNKQTQKKEEKTYLLTYLSQLQKTDLFKDTGSIDAVANVVDEFEKTDAESLERSIFDQRRIMKVKIYEDGLGQ